MLEPHQERDPSHGEFTNELSEVSAPAAGPRRPAARAGDVPLILVVDDDDGVRELASTILQEAGYRVLEAETGQRAMMLFEANPDIELIFTDLVMPGLDGFKLADMTKFKRPDIKILYATAFMDLAHDKLGVVHGHILKKPYRASQLEQIVKETLR
ncbi:MAG: response regulator [Proteobacteria bacterium]|nr:response regulator [Pseudomonadota bacterium]